MTLHRESRNTILLFVLLVLATGMGARLAAGELAQWAGWVLTAGWTVMLLLVLWFFRIPKRDLPAPDEAKVFAVSDGKIVIVERVHEPEWFQDERIQVSVFMSPLNVHAQWSPVAGKVLDVRYHPGKYLVAWHPKSSTLNERTTHVIETPRGPVLFRQIAGAVARRICWYIKKGDEVNAGDEVGFIKFGSRIDYYLPLDADVKVKIGDLVEGRSTVVAELA
jgi:phosphatidylserine decarboxylase